MIRACVYFLVLILSAFSLAQHIRINKTSTKGSDSLYISHYSDKIIVKLDIDSDVDRYKLTGSNFNYDIRPNSGMSKLLSFNYRFAYLAISYLPRVILKNKYDETRGETSGMGFGFGLSNPHVVADISYKQVRGFYLHNTSEYSPTWQSRDAYEQFPDLHSWSIRGTVFYKTNNRYSIRAIQTQTEAQRKSAKSFVPGIAYNYYVIDNQVPSTVSSSQQSKNLELLAQLNYYGTYVFKKRWYLSGGVGVAGGFNHAWLLTRLPSDRIKSTYTSGVLRGIANAGLGYNGVRFIAGAEVLMNRSFSNQEDGRVHMEFTRIAYQVFIGYRIKAPKIVDKTMDKMEGLFRF